MFVLRNNNYRQAIEEIVNTNHIKGIDIDHFIRKLEDGMINDMSDYELANLGSEIAAAMITINTEYSKLASAILIRYLHSITYNTFTEKVFYLNKSRNIFRSNILLLIEKHTQVYESIIDYSRDYNINYFGLCSLLRSYCLNVNGKWVERPQDIYMRLAIEIGGENFEIVKSTYDALSLQYYTHGTPAMFNSCLKKSQMASCFLTAMKGDSITLIFETLNELAVISKLNGGMGLHLSNLRSNGSPTITSGGFSKGIIPFIKIINNSLLLINSTTKRRVSACAIYLEPWHEDIFEFLDLRKNTGDEDMRAREIFSSLWIPDLFMERVEKDADWSLFDPNVAKGLHEVYGNEFKLLYHHHEKTKSRKIVKARNLWRAIIMAQIETGTPYMLYKDTANRLSNQKNLGTIKSSNLCAEIIEYSDNNETAVCNLSSVCLPKCVKVDDKGEKYFDFKLLKEVIGIMCYNTNMMIDKSIYPVESAKNSNLKNRPIGIGIQGLADVFMMMRYPFESKEARDLNSKIFETMYYAAVEKSVELAKVSGCYDTFVGSDLSKGIFQFEKSSRNIKLSGMWDWESLRKEVMTYGVRNSLFIALMPTASTSQICGNSECFEPITSNLFTRRTLAGEFQCVNKFLMEDLKRLNLWNDEMRQLLIEYEGSVQNIPVIPEEIKNLYKTVWEIKMKTIIDLAADRQAFVDQSQSMNLFLKTPTYAQLTSTHFYGWKSGLITGMYYLRMVPVSSTIKFTIDKDKLNRTIESMKSENFNLKTTTTDNDSLLECEGCSL